MSTGTDGILYKLTQWLVALLKMIFGVDPWLHFETEVMPSWLQAVDYLHSNELYLLDDNALGFGFIGPPLSGVTAAAFEKLSGLFQGQMPNDTVIQFILWPGPDIETTLDKYKRARLFAEGSFLNAAKEQFVSFYRNGATKSVVKGNDIRLRDVRLIVTGKVPVSENPSQEEIQRVLELRDVIREGLRPCGFRMELLRPADYLRYMQTIFNWGADATWRHSSETEYDPDAPLCEQILDFDNEVRQDENGLWLGSTRARVLSPRVYPKQAVWGQAYAYLGEVMSGANGLRDPTVLCMNLWFKDREGEAAKIGREGMWLTNQSGQAITRFRPEILDQKKSFDLANKQIGEGDRIVRMCFGMVVFAPDEKASVAAVTNAKSYMRTFGFQMLEDKYFAAPMFGNFMPFGADTKGEKAMRRWKRTTTKGATLMLPIMAEWRGTGTPALLLISRNGQLMSLSNWDSDQSYNCAIAAASGSGKSFLAQALLLNARMCGERFWIIDKGKSYRNIVELMGGQRLTFGKDSNLCVNPFTIVTDYDDEEDLLYAIVSSMAALLEPLGDFQAAEVKKTMRAVFMAKQAANEDMYVDDLARELIENKDQRVVDVGKQLHPFTREGGYGRLFYGKNNYEADNPVILLELDELEGRAHLQRVVLLQLMFQIQREMARLPRTLRKYLLIDEAWELIAGASVTNGIVDPIAEFIAKAYRQFRKHGGAAFAITQSIADFFINPVTRAIWENSPHKWLLGQTGFAVSQAQEKNWLDIGEHGFRLLRGLQSVQGEYSEIFAQTPYGYGVGRLIVPPVTRKLFSTTPADVEHIKQLRASGRSLEEAVEELCIKEGIIPEPRRKAA